VNRNAVTQRWPNSRAWSEIQRCPECDQRTLRVFWFERAGEPPKVVDEFCDYPKCRRGD
jgi:hypothetical protein